MDWSGLVMAIPGIFCCCFSSVYHSRQCFFTHSVGSMKCRRWLSRLPLKPGENALIKQFIRVSFFAFGPQRPSIASVGYKPPGKITILA